MSGIVGIVNLKGSPIAPPLLQSMTALMSDRGPDAQRIWLGDAVGFGHALLHTRSESQPDEQPCSLDGHIWITADARIDDRATLVQALRSGGISVPASTLVTQPDAVLILYAYQLWSDRCIEYLLGDFAFAIWDGRAQRLFCSRDHFGVKPFYYAHVGDWLLFSNTLNCLRAHPVVSDRLHDLAMADFLIFGFNQDATTTIFADIRRLPPAHCLTWTKATATQPPLLNLRRYWTLPTDESVRYSRGMDYVERFQELMEQSVSDRLQTPDAGVFMSGGLDSTTVAAVAKNCLARQYSSFNLCAHTVVYDRLIPDQERYYSSLAAEAIGIPIHYLVADDYTLFQSWNRPELRRPEPFMDPLAIIAAERLQQAARHGRVVLSGEGGDPVLFPAIGYFSQQLKLLHLGHLAKAIGQYISFTGRLPPVGLRTQLRLWLGKQHFWQPPYPSWLNPDFADRLHLRERWQQSTQGFSQRQASHKTRPEAYQLLSQPGWAATFEGFDPGVTGIPLEVRHPFFDVRLVKYLLAIPPIPWFIHKELMRVAMRGVLPEAVRLRPKTPLAGNPAYTLLQQSEGKYVDFIDPPSGLAQYIDWEQALRIMGGEQDTPDLWTNLRPLGLVQWFHNLETMGSNLNKGEVSC